MDNTPATTQSIAPAPVPAPPQSPPPPAPVIRPPAPVPAPPQPPPPPVPVIRPPAPAPVATTSTNSASVPETDSGHITAHTMERYQKILNAAKQYEVRYETVDKQRRRQLLAKIKEIMNKLRKETFDDLKMELLHFLNGQQQLSAGQPIQIINDNGWRTLLDRSSSSLSFISRTSCCFVCIDGDHHGSVTRW